ncbi:MAG: alpha/beta hydrolase [Micropruina sp.]|uniref:RBBP9/YdeN family alpha/beta hydrolase n=1 Tax=Micropruina sp. TaxID=2737536 RepID=UPI0039E22109
MTSQTAQTLGTTPHRALIFHGYGATPGDHWFGWLADQLDAAGIATIIPPLPDPLSPDRERWDDAVRAAVGAVDEGTAIVAHSLGCLTVLRYLRTLPGPWRLGTLVLVSGFVAPLPALPELDDYIGDGCDLTGLAERIDRLAVIRSDDDPFVPPPLTDRLAGLLGVAPRIVPGAGHFLADDGVTTLPEARDAVIPLPPRGRRARFTR